MASGKKSKSSKKGKTSGDSRNQLTQKADCFWNVHAVERGMKQYCNEHDLTVIKEETEVKTDKHGKEMFIVEKDKNGNERKDKNGKTMKKKVRQKTGKFFKDVPMFSNTAQVAMTAMLERLTEHITTVFVNNYPGSDDMVMDRDRLMSIIPKDDGLNDFYNLKKYNKKADHPIPVERKQISKYINSLKIGRDIEIENSALLVFKWLIATAYQETMKWAHIGMITFDKKTLSAKSLVKVVEGLFNEYLGNILTERMIQAVNAVGKYQEDPEIKSTSSSSSSKNKKKKSRGKKTKHVEQSDDESGSDDDNDNESGSGSDDDNDNESGSDNDSGSDDDNNRSRRRNNKKRGH